MNNIIEIPTQDGVMNCYVARPIGKGPFPTVILYMDIWGLREELFNIADRFTDLGYMCWIPNLYYREGDIRFDYRNSKQQVVSVDALPLEYRQKMFAYLIKLSNANVIQDTADLLQHLSTHQDFSSVPVAAIGYCMGGRHVLCAASSFPEQIQTMICLHGTEMISDKPDSPHLKFQALKGQLYCGYAQLDSYTNAHLIAQMQELAEQNKNLTYSFNVHPNANHGYALPDRDVFDPQADELDWQAIRSLLGNISK
jgi:carboxymethylenebutenolidase